MSSDTNRISSVHRCEHGSDWASYEVVTHVPERNHVKVRVRELEFICDMCGELNAFRHKVNMGVVKVKADIIGAA